MLEENAEGFWNCHSTAITRVKMSSILSDADTFETIKEPSRFIKTWNDFKVIILITVIYANVIYLRPGWIIIFNSSQQRSDMKETRVLIPRQEGSASGPNLSGDGQAPNWWSGRAVCGTQHSFPTNVYNFYVGDFSSANFWIHRS